MKFCPILVKLTVEIFAARENFHISDCRYVWQLPLDTPLPREERAILGRGAGGEGQELWLRLCRALSIVLLACVWPITAAVAQTPAAPLGAQDKQQMAAEQKLGADFATDFAKTAKFSQDKALTDRVTRIGQRIGAAANAIQIPAGYGNNRVYPFTWKFFVVESDDVNAFSVPGGYVYVNSGLLKMIGSDDELAGVLGHEVTHAAHHHIVKEMHDANKLSTDQLLVILAALAARGSPRDLANVAETSSLATMAIMNNKYGESAERDADHGGVLYMQKAGFNPVGMLSFMLKLQDMEHRSPNVAEGIFQDHPYTDERVVAIRTELAGMGIHSTPEELNSLSAATSDYFTTAVVNAGTREIMYGKTVCATIHDPDGSRAAGLIGLLNADLDAGLKLDQISASHDTVLIDDRPWLIVLPADVAAQAAATPDSVAAAVAHSLQVIVYRRSFDTSSGAGGSI